MSLVVTKIEDLGIEVALSGSHWITITTAGFQPKRITVANFLALAGVPAAITTANAYTDTKFAGVGSIGFQGIADDSTVPGAHVNGRLWLAESLATDQVFANFGGVTIQANSLVAIHDNGVTYTAHKLSAGGLGGGGDASEVVLTDAATTIWDYEDGRNAYWLIEGSNTLQVDNLPAGRTLLFLELEIGSGGDIPIWPAEFEPEQGYVVPSAVEGETHLFAVRWTGTRGLLLKPNSFDAPSVPAPEALVFGAGATESPAGVWTGTTPGGWNSNMIVATKSLAALADGYIQSEYDQADADTVMMAFSDTITPEIYASYEAAFAFNGGSLYRIDNSGAFTNTGQAVSFGDLVRIIRTGSVLKLQHSATAGSSWTDIYTYTFSSTTQLYIQANLYSTSGKLYYPQGFNVS